MGYLYFDTLAFVTKGYWTEERIQILEDITVTVVDVTEFTVTITCEM